MTSEKVSPSPITIVADIASAIEIEKRMNRGTKLPLRDALARVSADYNKMVTAKRHRIDSNKKALVYNLRLDSD